MNNIKSTLLALATSAVLTLPSAANALDVCGEEMAALESAINSASFLGRKASTDQSNMLAKYDAAIAKRALYKFSDAIDKLDDISDKATALAGAAKAKLEDATAINESVSAAIQCIGAL